MKEYIHIPYIAPAKLTEEIINSVNAISASLRAPNKLEAERSVESQCAISKRTQRRYKTELRKMFELGSHTDLAVLAEHPQLRHALEFIITRKERTDALQLRSAKQLYVVATSGELIDVEKYLLALYRNSDAPAALDCYTALLGRQKNKLVLKEDGTPAAREELPADTSVVRFLGRWREHDLNIKLGRMREHDVITKELGYVSRTPEDFAPGEHWFGDHTEHPFELYNEETKRVEHWWLTAWIDLRTGVLVGYHNAPKPNSETIALAFRNAVLGTQLKAAVVDDAGKERYEDVHITNVPSDITIDNGKDYRSNATQRTFGQIDFTDRHKHCISHLYTNLHYAAPYHAQTKGMIEVWFRTYQRILKYLPAYRGSNYSQKPDSHKKDMQQGNILTVATFLKLFELAVNAYNNRIKRRLKDQSPLQYYLTHYTMQRSIDTRVLDFLMMHQHERVVERSQIEMFTAKYYSDSLTKFNHQKVDVYYDPSDLGYISVYVGREFAGVAMNKELMGKTQRGWTKILVDRRNALKGIHADLKQAKVNLSGIDAKYELLAGQLMNTVPVSRELLSKTVPDITVLTGIEAQAKETLAAVETQKNVIEIQKQAKKRASGVVLDISMVANLK